MTTDNGYFKIGDENSHEVAGYRLSAGWWSRHYEYPWALKHADADSTVADMGTGYSPRPFRHMLADVCEKVYAVDSNPKLLDMPMKPNCEPMVARMEDVPIEDDSLDAIFCISVLEHCRNNLDILKEFHDVLRPGGKLICTFDVPYDDDVPLGKWEGIRIEEMQKVFDASPFTADLTGSKDGAMFHPEWNLCVYHMVTTKEAE